MELFFEKSILILSLMLFVSGSFAKNVDRSSIPVQGYEKSAHLHSVTVKRQVYIDGGSYQGETCTVRYDDRLNLLQVGENCGVVKKIHLYNADDMWLGAAVGVFKSGYSYNSVYSNSVAYAKYIEIENEWGPIQENRIRCNQKKWKIKFDGYSYSCVAPFGCGRNEYVVDDEKCRTLPLNAVRDNPVGFKCKNGYYFWQESNSCEKLPPNAVADASGGYTCEEGFFYDNVNDKCLLPYQCRKGEYAVDEKTCESLPVGALRNKTTGFKCKNGYYFWQESNSCEKLPAHAIADASGGYSCEEGFIYDNVNDKCWSPYQCRKGEYAVDEKICKPLPVGALRNKTTGFNCMEGYFFWSESNACEKLPPHAVADSDGGFICDEDYLYDEINDKCISPFTCGKGEYAINETTCAKLPRGAVRTKTVGYLCSKGYYKTEYDSCLKLPQNAIPDEDFGFSCKDGFYLDKQACHAKFGCAKGEYAIDETTCDKLPSNAIRSKNEGFSCKKGYYLTNENECIKLPANAIAVESGFVCDKGFVRKDDGCRKPYQCLDGEFALDSILCEKLPENAIRLKTAGYKCREKYFKPAWSLDCEMIPENSIINETGDDFNCKPGYIRESISCIQDVE